MMERDDIGVLGARILKELSHKNPAHPEELLVRVTSGTSSGEPLVLVTRYHPDSPADMAELGLERVISCSGSMGARLANTLVVSRSPKARVMWVLPLDPGDLMPGLDELLSDYAPTALYGFPSYIVRTSQYLERGAAGVRRITLVGETLTLPLERTLRGRFFNAQLVEQYMATEAAGYIGNRFCPYLSRNCFHPARDVTIEIADPNEEGVGDVLVTKSIFNGVWLERYRIGDVGRLVPGICRCGMPVTFELLGRSGIDYIKLGGALLRREEFDRVVSTLQGLVDDYRVEAWPGDEAEPGKVRIYLYRRGGAGTAGLADELAAKISRRLFVTKTKTFYDLASSGVLSPLEAEFVEAPFTHGHKDVKLRMRTH